MHRAFILVMVASTGCATLAFAGRVRRTDVPRPAPCGMLFIDEELVEDTGPVNDGESAPAPPRQTLEQIIASLGDIKPGTGKRREAAEQQLVDMGSGSLDHLKKLSGAQKGVPRDVLLVAIFRLEHAPLSPRELIGAWVSKAADGDPAKVVLERVVAEELRHSFPNHLFYRVHSPGEPGAKGTFPPTVLALAADGKVQPVGDDASLAKFLKHELPEGQSLTQRRRALGAAAILALARDMPESAEPISDGQINGTSGTGTAWFSGKKAKKISVAFTLQADGSVAGVTSGPADNAPAEEPPRKAGAEENATAPADSQPADRIQKRPALRSRFLAPPPPLVPNNDG